MNLGTVALRSVSYNSPRILRQPSHQSATASPDHDQYSFSDYVSDLSSFDDRVTVIRWKTPPTNSPSPPISDPSRRSSRSHRSGGPPAARQLPTREEIRSPSPIFVRFHDQTPSRSPDPLEDPPFHTPPSRVMDLDSRPPTPGVDDSPYIRYAINSITRDGEGDPLTRPKSGDSDESYPVERIIPDEGLGYLPSGGGRRPPVRSAESEKEPKSLPFKSQVFIPVDPPEHSPHHPLLSFKPTPLRPWALCVLMIFCILEIAGIAYSVAYSRNHQGLWDYRGDREGRYFVLEFLPQFLAAVLLFLILSVQTAVVRMMPFVSMASKSASMRSNAILMPLFPTGFLLPQPLYLRGSGVTIGSCLIVFWLSLLTVPLQSSLFQAQLCDVNGHQTWRWIAVQPVAYMLLVLYSVLLVALVITLLYFARHQTGLKWNPTSLADIVLMLQRSNSLADYRSSETFATKQDFRKCLHLRSDRLGYWKTRGGGPTSSHEIFYAMGEEGAPIRTYTMLNGKVMPTTTPSHPHQPPVAAHEADYYDLEAGQHPPSSSHHHKNPQSSTIVSLQAKIYSPAVRYRYLPVVLRRMPLVAMVLVALSLLFAFIVASYTKHALTRGFPPLLRTAPSPATGFSPAGFLYSFIPSGLGLILTLSHQSLDLRIRALEPFTKLSSPSGATAENSLLLDYAACSAPEAALKALLAGDYLIASLSLNSLLSFALPILAGGLFWAISFPSASSPGEEVRMLASPTTLAVLAVSLILYTLSFPLILFWKLPRQQSRSMPHDITSLAEIMSFLYASPLLDDPLFYASSYSGGGGGVVKSKTDLVTRLMGVAPGEREVARFALGVGRGRDGKEHLMVDRLSRPGGTGLIVHTGRVR